ncbi:aminomethyl-transferring glycine dehydrogenase subunit GcvPB [Anaerotignum sp.]|uniref:aminomethyl-transferring glycine dehydrogenase subunit GcvPB n=1 Tax=Anaerotignum sp. TaxID=2039241 RepID=UPI0027151DFC|nr:aminomethyl-transferring glycine dehydrogenase subunit GcvPB [Anaerotignum sp.]
MLIFEKSREGREISLLPICDVPEVMLSPQFHRNMVLRLPEISENDLSRHYSEIGEKTYGVNQGAYPLGSCTMKYNPKINEELAGLTGFTEIHPLQKEDTVQGCLEVLSMLEKYLCEITGMTHFTMQPAAGAHGELTGLLMIKAFHHKRGDTKRTKIIIPDSAHGTNPASATMAGFETVTVPSDKDGGVDIEKLKEAIGNDTAGLMLTNPNTLGLFDKNIMEITNMIHDCGGINYYDGANLNAVMGIARPGDMGFDVIHVNLHKTFSAPHGGGGPGSGPVGCKKFLSEFLPSVRSEEEKGKFCFVKAENAIGEMKSFYGNFLVVVRALAYLMTLGREGVLQASEYAVLNANYMFHKLKDLYPPAYDRSCMHEFVFSLEKLKKETGVSALDIAKAMLDKGIHPPTMYFPLIVHEALMFEPTETESKETMDDMVQILRDLYEEAHTTPDILCNAPITTSVGRLNEVEAARNPILRYQSNDEKGAI